MLSGASLVSVIICKNNLQSFLKIHILMLFCYKFWNKFSYCEPFCSEMELKLFQAASLLGILCSFISIVSKISLICDSYADV